MNSWPLLKGCRHSSQQISHRHDSSLALHFTTIDILALHFITISNITEPLNTRTQKGVQFVMINECINEFAAL